MNDDITRITTSNTVRLVSLFVLVVLARLPELTTIGLADIVGIIAIISYLFSTNEKNHYPLNYYPELICLIIIAGLMILSTPFSVWPGRSFVFIRYILPKIFVIFYIIMRSVTNERELKTITFVFAISGVVYLILLFFAGTTVAEWRESFGYTLDPNDAALLMIITLPFIAFFYQTSPGYLKPFWLICFVLICVGITKTGSRGGFLGFFSVVVLLMYNFGRRNFFRNILLVCLVLLSISFYSPEKYWERVTSIKDYEKEETAEQRFAIWRKGVGFMLNKPVFGVGIYCFPQAEGGTHSATGGGWMNAHNSFIQIGAEIGIGGLISFVLLFYLTCKRLKRISRDLIDDKENVFLYNLAIACRVALIGYVITGFFLSQAYYPAIYYLLGVSFALSAVYENTRQQTPAD